MKCRSSSLQPQDATLLRDTFYASRVLRTMLGERCVLTHRGWAGEKTDFPNILLDLLGAPVSACRGVIPTVDGEMTLSCTTHNPSDAQGLWLQRYEWGEGRILGDYGIRKEGKPWPSTGELAVQKRRHDADFSMSDRLLAERGGKLS